MCNPVQHPPVKRQHQPRTNSVHTQLRLNRQLWLRQAISAVNARNSESDKQKTRTSATHNLQFLPKAQYDHKRNPYRCTRARFSFAFSRSALNSLRSTAGASCNTRDTGSEVRSASSSPSQATLTTNSSALEARLIAEMIRMWYSPWFSNCWKACGARR